MQFDIIYGHISTAQGGRKKIDGVDAILQKRQLIKVAERFNFMGFSFNVHRSNGGEGWVVSEAVSGMITSTKKDKGGNNKEAYHSKIADAVKQSNKNVKDFLSNNSTAHLQSKIDYSYRVTVLQRNDYINLKLKNIIK